MKTVIAPIVPDTQGEDVFNLQEILQLFVDREMIKIPKDEWDNMLPDFSREQKRQFYGEKTANLLVQFRMQNNLGDGHDVDEATAKAINSLLDVLVNKLNVKGTVSAEGKPARNMLVKAYHKDMRSLEFLGEAYTDKEGKYEITYTGANLDQSKREITNLVVFTYDNNLEIAHSQTYFDAPSTAIVYILLPEKDKLSEYERMVAALKPLMKELSFEALTEADMDFLAGNSKTPREHIVLLRLAFITAAKHVNRNDVVGGRPDNKDLLIPVPAFYGWFRQGLPTDSHVLFARSAEELITSIKTAIKVQIIPALDAEIIKKITEAINQLAVERLLNPAKDSAPSLGDVLNTIPGKLSFDRQFIVARVLQDKDNPEIPLGEKLKSAGLEETQVIAVERTLAFQSFSNNFLPLIKTLQEDAEINSLKELALKVNKENFTRKIIDKKAFPEGENPEDFAGKLYNNLFHAEPTAMLRNMLEDDKIKLVEDVPTRTSVASFLSNLPEAFNIKTTSVYEAFKYEKAFEGIAPEFHGKVKSELKSLQRIAAISPTPEVVPVLMKARVTSSLMVSDMPEEQFVRGFTERLGKDGETVARQVHTNAVSARIRNEQALISLREVERGTGIAMVDQAMKSNFSKNIAFKETLERNHLSWDLLFGDADFCECGECTSVYSAAAYYVDLLQYLRNNNLDPKYQDAIKNGISGTFLEKLFGRRPDLMCLQLTCKNTNTILPYVDLVNEVMESYVAVQKTLPFDVGKDETSGELLAEPQHTEDEAYKLLKDAVYPFTLPYHQPIDAERIYLNSLGTSRYELMNTFRLARDSKYVLEPLISYDSKIALPLTAGDLEDLYKNYLDNAVDAEYLGLTEEEYVILTKEAFVSKEYWDKQSALVHTQSEYLGKIKAKEVHEYYGYGYSEEPVMLNTDEHKQDGLTFVKKQFLKRTGLQYLELVELLKTQCLFPAMPKEQSLSIMESIKFSYGFLQALIHNSTDAKQKYESVIGFLIPALLKGDDDPCKSEVIADPLTEEELKKKMEEEKQKVEGIKQWIYDYFEGAGKIIVLENEVKCIDGRLGILSDNPDGDIISDGYIKKCRIYGEMGELIGAINKSTGLITMEPGQPDRDWSKIKLFRETGADTTFVKISGKYYLVSLADRTDTCNLDSVRLIHLDGTPLTVKEYDSIHRFIRLWRKLGWTINETDNAIVSLSTTNEFDISPPLLQQLASVKKLQVQTGLELTKLLAFWTNIDTVGEKSLYKRLFLTHNLVGIDSVFHDKNGLYLTDPGIEILKHAPVLMAALNFKANDIDAVMRHEDIKYLTLENVSKLYRHRLLSKLLGLTVTEFISVLPLFEDPFGDAGATLLFLEQWKKIEYAGFNHLQLNYIIQHQDDPKKPVGLTKKGALQLAKTLYDGLNAIEEVHQDIKASSEITDPLEQENAKYTLATTELVKEKAGMLYEQATIEKIIGVLEGTTIYSASGPAGFKDLLRPIPLISPATIQDYEFLQLDNYPLLKKKIKYESTKGSLQIEGILTEFEGKGSSLFFGDDFIDLSGLVTQLTGSDLVSKYLWNQFTVSGRAIITAQSTTASELKQEVIKELNKLISGSASIYDAPNFNGVKLSAATNELRNRIPAVAGDELILLNRLLLEDAYPKEIAKNKRIGFNTISNHQSSGISLADTATSIKNQQTKLANEIFNEIFTPSEVIFLVKGDTNDLPIGTENNINNNTAPLKRLKFLEIFLPYLRKELSHRFIVNTLSTQAGLSNDVTDLLITKILKAGPSPVSIYTLFENITKVVYPNYNRWVGGLIPSVEGQYTFIIKDSYSKPNLSIDGTRVDFVAQASSPFEWRSAEQRLLTGKQYKVELYRTNPENLYWKTATSSITPIPSTFSFSGWDGYLIPSVGGEYIFIVKSRIDAPNLKIDGQSVPFDLSPGLTDQWQSTNQKLLAGKGFKLTLAEMNLESIYWKTATSSVASIPATVIMSGWDGYLIPSAGGQYTFIVNGSSETPDLSIDGKPVTFKEKNPGEWWSTADPNEDPNDALRLQGGKIYKLFISEMNMERVYWKTATSSITSIPSASLLPGYAEETMKAFVLLQKAALLVNGFKLSAAEIQHISKYSVDFGNLNFNEIKLTHFLRLESYIRLRNSLPEAKINILEFFKWTHNPTASAIKLSEKIEELTGWKKGPVEKLIQDYHFKLLQLKLFHNEINLIKLQQALEVANKITIDINLLFDWAKPNSDFDACRKIANNIKHAIRAQYKQEDWEQLVKPLSDKLRENQKNALIAYLLVQTAVMEWGVTDADGLFEFFLIDVQMDACMETSRIKQAISSVQLFVQRCFLGLESRKKIDGTEMGVAHGTLDRQRWEWMQRYRVWEANRKVFLYPENWIESNLRDDKSPFFKELESELLQKDINKQNVVDALKAYLYKVDEVANMEVIGVHIEMGIYMEDGQSIEKGKKLHVFSRTRNAPYFFYYRYLDMLEGNWYPWEKMQVDIPSYDVEDLREVIKDGNTYILNRNFKNIIGNGCYLTPVVWNQRLLVFFPQFMRKTIANDVAASPKSIKDLSEESTSTLKAIEYWEIKMAWSEYRNGKWTQKQLSKDAICDIPNIQDQKAVTKFWKDIYDAANANAKVVAAKKKLDDALENLILETENLKEEFSTRSYYPNPVVITELIIETITYDSGVATYTMTGIAKNVSGGAEGRFKRNISAPHPYVVANEKCKEAKKAHDAMVKTSSPPTTVLPILSSDISKYEFVPVIYGPGSSVGIKLFYEGEGINSFDFNGSNTKVTNSYPGSRSIAVNRFHHYSSNNSLSINSLQKSSFASEYTFDDGTATTFTHYSSLSNSTIKFNHTDANKLLGVINAQQLEAFFKFPIAEIGKLPTTGTLVSEFKDDVFGGHKNKDGKHLYHELKRPYSIYNWELFFHTPMMLADALSKSQQFEEAMKWYHYVFNPVADGPDSNRFWQFSPFKDTDAKNILDQILNKLKPNELNDDINEWRNNPFKPHLVARSRAGAYMKWVVMKYVDNLVAWGDYLFRQDTIESINQATQLYVLAGHILGPRPQMIPKRGNIKPQTYLSLLDRWDANSNAIVELEMVFPFSSQTVLPMIKPEVGGSTFHASNHASVSNGVVGLANVFGFASSTYFCIPNNPKLMGYWDTISDRLFKIRHCENIEGMFRKLPLFEPPIDPALLVKAVAQGLSISSVINDLNTAMPNYRFYYLLQKALELCNELKSLGGSMLSAIEKKDNETISLIRAKHENGMLNLVMEIKEQQLEEAQKTLEGLHQNRKSPEHRMKYYLQLIGEDINKVPNPDSDFAELANSIEKPVDESGLRINKFEKEDIEKANLSAILQLSSGIPETLASILYVIPQIAADVKPFGLGAGATFGGSNLGQLTQAVSKGIQIAASYLSHESSIAAKKGGFQRALQDRVMQANAAGYEIKQIDKQILSQQIRIGIANLEISNHQKQIDNANEVEEFLKNKYSNEELYTWMRGSLKTLYRQVYNLAYDLAKKAEKTYCFERGISHANFIQSGYFDAGREGLLAGEQLYVGLKQLESSYQEKRCYDYEITKHVSVRQLNPISLLQLKASGTCEFDIPEVLFDMDFPGHFKRRIKSVSVSIPCVAGPYTGVNATLRLLNNKFRNSSIANNYLEKTDEQDDRFISYNIPITAIATSSAQNDAGMFELNFKDERYLPFEGAGVVSRWKLELPTIKQFDYLTISDVVLHVKYTASEGGEQLKASATGSVNTILSTAAQRSEQDGLFTLISLKHDMPNEWNLLKQKKTAKIKIDKSRLPYFAQISKNGATISKVVLISKSATPPIKRKATLEATAVELGVFVPLGETGLYRIDLPNVSFDEPLILSSDETTQNKLDELALIVKFEA